MAHWGGGGEGEGEGVGELSRQKQTILLTYSLINNFQLIIYFL